MLSKLFSAAPRTNEQSRRNAIRRRMFRPEHLEDRRLLAAFQGLGALDEGAFFSYAHGISDDGQVVVGESIGTSGERYPFRWSTSEGMVQLETDEANSLPAGVARAASADGSGVIGTLYAPSTDYVGAVQWERVGESDVLTRIADPNRMNSTWDISSDGQFIVGQQRAAGEPREAHLWNAVTGVATPLGTLIAGGSSEARAVSDDGKFVTGEAASNADSGRDVFLWNAEDMTMTSLDIAGSGHDISADGSVVVGWEDVVTKSRNGRIRDIYFEAFRWTNAGKVSLGDLPGGDYQSLAYAVSGDGTVIAGSSSSIRGSEAFVWTEDTGMRSLQEILSVGHGLDLTGWQLQGVRDVSADGTTFVGVGMNPDGNSEAFIASLGPSTPSFSVNDVEITEGDSGTVVAQFTVSRSGDSSSAVSVDVSTSDGTATVADNDYVAVSRTLQFDAGVTQLTFDVTVNGDLNEELDETFFVDLTNPSTGATVSDGQGVGTIIDDDTNYAPIAVDDAASVASGDSVGIDVLANDSDPDGDPLSFAAVPDVSVNGGSVALNADNTLTYTPPATFVGTDTFNYTITDGQSTSTATVSIAVTDTASMYVADIALIEQPRGKNGTEYRISVLVNDVQSNNPLAGVQVTVFIDGKTYTGTTDSEGIFITESLKGIKSGTYSAQVDLALSDYDYELAPLLDSSLYEDDSDNNGLADAELTIS